MCEHEKGSDQPAAKAEIVSGIASALFFLFLKYSLLFNYVCAGERQTSASSKSRRSYRPACAVFFFFSNAPHVLIVCEHEKGSDQPAAKAEIVSGIASALFFLFLKYSLLFNYVCAGERQTSASSKSRRSYRPAPAFFFLFLKCSPCTNCVSMRKAAFSQRRRQGNVSHFFSLFLKYFPCSNCVRA